jgi:putative DNA primase/helicase
MKNVIPWDVNLDTSTDYLDSNDSENILDYSDTPYTDKLIIDWVGADYLKTMYEIIGFVMIRDYPLHRIICLIGEGSNGKSCFVRLLEKIIGVGNYTSSDLYRLANSGFETAKLYNRLMCTINEIDHTVFRQTALIKRLTGQDLINMEIKFKNPFDARNYAKIVIATNTLPQTKDKSDGFFRRWLIIDFPNRFNEGMDPVLDIPEEEISKLCGKAVKLIPELLERESFSKEGNPEQRKAKFLERSSSLYEFIKEYCDQVDGEHISCAEFIMLYREYCSANGYAEQSNQMIGKEMSDIGYSSIQKRAGYNQRVYPNLKWKRGISDDF